MRSWIAIPVLGAACAGAAAGFGATTPLPIAAAGACGAGLASAVRALAGDSPASIVATALAPLLAIATYFALGMVEPRALIAVGAAAWTAVELARPSTSPLVALLPASVALALDPAFVALPLLAGARVMTAPWARPRWAVLVPIAAAIALAVRFGLAWSHARGHIAPAAYALELADALGPLMAVAALAGLASLARTRHAELGLAVSLACALALGLRGGVLAPSLIGLAALSAGLAVGRFAALVRLGAGQAFAGATASLLLLLAPAWSALAP